MLKQVCILASHRGSVAVHLGLNSLSPSAACRLNHCQQYYSYPPTVTQVITKSSQESRTVSPTQQPPLKLPLAERISKRWPGYETLASFPGRCDGDYSVPCLFSSRLAAQNWQCPFFSDKRPGSVHIGSLEGHFSCSVNNHTLFHLPCTWIDVSLGYICRSGPILEVSVSWASWVYSCCTSEYTVVLGGCRNISVNSYVYRKISRY